MRLVVGEGNRAKIDAGGKSGWVAVGGSIGEVKTGSWQIHNHACQTTEHRCHCRRVVIRAANPFDSPGSQRNLVGRSGTNFLIGDKRF